MNVNSVEHGLSKKELRTIKEILAGFSEKIDRVGLFGSRATRKYEEYSDIDIVFYGSLNRQETARLNTLFDESNLGLRVDIKNYNDIEYPPLQRHIDASVRILFTKEQLLTKNILA